MRDKITKRTFHPGMFDKSMDEDKQGEAYLREVPSKGTGKLAYIETYGCQMNFSDTEIVASILSDMKYEFTAEEQEADLVLIKPVVSGRTLKPKSGNRLKNLRSKKIHNPDMLVGVLGCMAERLKSKLLEEEQLVRYGRWSRCL